jgi:hypothetical protein
MKHWTSAITLANYFTRHNLSYHNKRNPAYSDLYYKTFLVFSLDCRARFLFITNLYHYLACKHNTGNIGVPKFIIRFCIKQISNDMHAIKL